MCFFFKDNFSAICLFLLLLLFLGLQIRPDGEALWNPELWLKGLWGIFSSARGWCLLRAEMGKGIFVTERLHWDSFCYCCQLLAPPLPLDRVTCGGWQVWADRCELTGCRLPLSRSSKNHAVFAPPLSSAPLAKPMACSHQGPFLQLWCWKEDTWNWPTKDIKCEWEINQRFGGCLYSKLWKLMDGFWNNWTLCLVDYSHKENKAMLCLWSVM